jgi:hypothetical protein
VTAIKPSSHGIVVDHKETEIRYAISDKNYNPKIHTKVRDLKAGETVRGFTHKGKADLQPELDIPETPDPKDVENTTPHLDLTKPVKSDTK